MTIIIESKNPYNHRWSFKMELQQEPLIIKRFRDTQYILFNDSFSPSSASSEEDISDETKMILGSSPNILFDGEREKVLYNDCFESREEIIENLHILDSRLKTHFRTVYLLIKSGHEDDKCLIDHQLKDLLMDYGLRKILPFPRMMAERTSCKLAIDFMKTNQDDITNIFDGIVIDKDYTYDLPKIIRMATYKDLLNIIECIRKNLDKAFASRLEKVVSPISKNDKSWNTSLGQLISSIIKNDAIVDNPPGNSYETEYETLKAFEKLAWIVGEDGRIIFS